VKFKMSLAIVFVLFLLGCSREGEPSREQVEAQLVKDVEIKVAQPESVEVFFEAVGTVRSRKTATLSSKVVGTVIAVLVKEGDRVKRGQALIEVDSRDLRAELQGARASLEEAEWAIKAAESAISAAKGQRDLAAATFKRYETLVARGSVTPQEYDEVSAKYKVANAELERAEENLGALKAKREQARARVSYIQTLLAYTTIASPFDGVVTAKIGEVGMIASPGTPLLTVEETSRYRLEAEVGESWLAHARVGSMVSVIIDALKVALSGKIAEIVPAADPQSRTFTVKIDLPPHPLLRSGLYGKASFPVGKKEVLLVPPEAILQRGQLLGLSVVDKDGAVRLRLVKTGKRYNQKVEILSGLSPGERVIVRGMERVAEGSRVVLPSVQ
jgi:multidrug efflux pump subunit AcrA (membrane-fusion protein)